MKINDAKFSLSKLNIENSGISLIDDEPPMKTQEISQTGQIGAKVSMKNLNQSMNKSKFELKLADLIKWNF